ncbi:MtsA protein [Myxococcota bacterium]|nr:MtsA protein [Myxococcota bacterium]
MSGKHLALAAVGAVAIALTASLALRARTGPGGSERNAGSPAPSAGPRLTFVGPRQISNQSAYPVMIWGEALEPGMTLVVKTSPPVSVPTSFVDARHLTAVIPAGLPILSNLSTVDVTLALVTARGDAVAGDARLTVSNDTAFPTPYALELVELDGGPLLFSASPSTDELRVHTKAAPSRTVAIPVGDRPRALARFTDTEREPWLAVAHGGGTLELLRVRAIARALTATATVVTLTPDDRRTFDLGVDLQDLAIDEARARAYVTSHVRDRVLVVDLARGAVVAEHAVGINPRAITLARGGRAAIVANIQSEDVSTVDLERGAEVRTRPAPGTPIIGGHTERYSALVMGGKAGRGLVASERLGVAFMSTLGPNVGPNADRMEVTQNGGITVIDPATGRHLRHVSMLHGVPEGLALDDARGLLYAADGATGRVAIFDAKALATSDATARRALLGAYVLPRPEGVPLIRPEADLGVEGRSPAALHFGAKAVELGSSGGSLFVLSRFSGAIVELDTAKAKKGELRLVETYSPWIPPVQQDRRRGEVVYFTDLGDSRMTCDTCHPEGHVGGLLFSKGRPIRIYRGLGLRAIRTSPPYFTPSRLPSIRRTAQDVLARNRFQNPKPTEQEESSLTEYVGAIAGLPNPFVGKNGELPEALVLPDGRTGDAKAGLALFEGRAGCAQSACHPPPAFTGDDDPKTRGTLHVLGTPKAIPLRPELQDLAPEHGHPPPSLMGVWDTWPLFLSGAGGNELAPDGTIVPAQPFALRWALENPAWAGHLKGAVLSERERDDLLAYLMTL